MRFLVDAQLPRRLATALADLGHDAIHTLDLPDRNATTDREVAAVADREDRNVVTKDNDFRDSYLLTAQPHRLLHVTTGNITNAALRDYLNVDRPRSPPALNSVTDCRTPSSKRPEEPHPADTG